MDDLDKLLKKSLKDPEFKKEWDKTELQYQITRQIIKARIEGNVSQRALAKKAKTTQAVISRIENMSMNPSVKLLEKIAKALGKDLKISFV